MRQQKVHEVGSNEKHHIPKGHRHAKLDRSTHCGSCLPSCLELLHPKCRVVFQKVKLVKKHLWGCLEKERLEFINLRICGSAAPAHEC